MIKKSIQKFVDRLFKPIHHKVGKLKVYQHDQHHIDRRLISRNAIKVCEVLQQHGYQAYIVGGAVRDLILGIAPKDFDVATSARPEQVQKLLRRTRIIGRRFRLVHVVFGREIIETSTFRSALDSDKHTDEHGRILNDNVFGTLEEDAARRDFTLNALYYDPTKQEVLDFHNGVTDLKNHVVRIIGDPVTRFREDPVRMLRAVRFSSKLNGTIEPNTLAPIKELADLISNVPDARLFDECIKLMTCGNSLHCLRSLRQLGLHEGILPLLDLVLEQEGGSKFIQLVLERTDQRIYANKTVSPSFLYASLLWPLVNSHWQQRFKLGEPAVPALVNVANSILDERAKKLSLQRRHSSEMRDIWFMQPRFEKRNPRSIHRLMEQPRFRAAVDFLQIRAACGEFDSVLAQWWMDLADADDSARFQMIEELHTQSAHAIPSAAKKKRRRRRAPRKTAQTAQPTTTHKLS